MLKATKIRIYPDAEQQVFLDRQFGAVRFVFNKSLHVMSTQYRRHGLSLSAKRDMKKLLPVAKKSRRYSWLKDFDSVALQQACINLDRAFQNFFDPKLPARYPRFKRKHGSQASYHCMSVSHGVDWIKVPKCSRIKARVHREFDGQLKSITLSKTTTGKYYASLLVDTGVEPPKPLQALDADRVVGLDMGLTHLVIDSNGTKWDNPRFLKRAAANLRRKQKALSRCQKGSKGRAKARAKVAKAHDRIANARNDFQHKLTRHYANENQVVAVESLQVKNMVKNRCLSKAISDASWSSLIAMLDYKCREQGKYLVRIDRFYPSSKTCHVCGHKMDKLPLAVREWTCPVCSSVLDRDWNAALNIRQQGIMKLCAEGLPAPANGALRKTRTLRAVG